MMSTSTTNLHLTKPAANEHADIAIINANYDLIDEFAGTVVVDPDYVHTENNYTTTEKQKLEGLENYTLPTASSSTKGGVKVDNESISIDQSGTISAALSGLNEVNIDAVTLSDGQTLKYDATSGEWVNASVGGTTVVANPSGTATADLVKLQVGNNIYGIPSGGGGSASWTDVTGTLTAGSTSITLSDSSIETTSTIDFYTNEFGVNPTAVSVSTGSVTLTFEAQSTDLGVKIRVTNGSGGGGNSQIEYSTTEKVVGKWIDGSDVYEKTIYYAGGVSGDCSFAHNISNFGRLISIEGSAHDNYESGTDLPLPKIDPNGYHIGIQSVDSTNITYIVPSVYVARIVDIYVTIRYTKSQS